MHGQPDDDKYAIMMFMLKDMRYTTVFDALNT